MKKYTSVYLSILIMILMISLAAAADFDNVKSLSKNQTERYGTITIKNLFGVGQTLAAYTLFDNSERCLYSCFAEGRAVINSPDILFRNIIPRGGNAFEIKVYLQDGVQPVQINDVRIIETCKNENLNGTQTRVCSKREIINPRTEVRKKWILYDGSILKQGAYNWRIEATKRNNQNLDWVANAYGLPLDEWAFWIGVTPTAYWKFNEANGGANDTIGRHNFTYIAGTEYRLGKLNNSILVNGSVNNGLTTGGSSDFAMGTGNFSIAYWFNAPPEGSATAMIGIAGGATGINICRSCASSTSNTLRIAGSSILSTDNIANSSYHRIVWVREGTGAGQLKLYVDGILNKTGISPDDFSDATTGFNILNGGGSATSIVIDDLQIFKGYAWTAGDALTDYNGGAGREADIGNTPGTLAVILNAPSSGSALSSTNISFNATISATSANNTNASLYVWNSADALIFNAYNTTIKNNGTINVAFFANFSVGTYHWNILAGGTNVTGSAINSSYAISNNTFSIGVTLNSASYNSSTYETAREAFTAAFNVLPGFSITQVQLVYNGTNYTISDFSQANNTLTIRKSIDIPLNLNKFQNESKNFFFRFSFSGNAVQESQIFQQNVSFINLQECNATYNSKALNFTMIDEVTGLNISAASNPASLLSSFRYWVGGGDTSKNYSLSIINDSSRNNFAFCILPPGISTFRADMDSEYQATGYSINNYYLRNATLSNATNNIPLYLIPTASSTKFYVNVKSGTSLLSGAIVYVAKYFVGEGQFKTTAIKLTDDNGQFYLYGDLDKPYKFSIIKDGVLLGIIDKTLACSVAPCSIDLNVNTGSGSAYDNFTTYYAANILSNISFNPANKIVSYQFVDISGLANYFRLTVQKTSVNNTAGALVCDTSTFSTFGTLSCNATGFEGDFIARGFISRSPEVPDKYISFYINASIIQGLGLMAIVLNIIIILTAIVASGVVSGGNPSAMFFMTGAVILLLKISSIFIFSWTIVALIELFLVILLVKSKT
jgi:hypothetical protein